MTLTQMELDELEEEAKKKHKRADGVGGNLIALNPAGILELVRVYRQATKLKENLDEYGQHLGNCHMNMGPWILSRTCTCGFDEARGRKP